MLAAFHDPDHVDAGRLGLPLIRVLHLKLHAASQAPGLGFGRRHSRLNRTDGHAGHFAIELLGQPHRRSTEAATDIEHASASRERRLVPPDAPSVGSARARPIHCFPNNHDEDARPRRDDTETTADRNAVRM